jgi:hypothetical protein
MRTKTMSTQDTQRATGTIEDDTLVKAVRIVLNYLWEDERQHYEQHGSGDAGHILQSLQVLRQWLSGTRDGLPDPAIPSKKIPPEGTDSGSENVDNTVRSTKITLLEGDFGTYILAADDGRDTLIQTDWDYPGVASTFGWSPCSCGMTDGTVDCPHRTASEMIAEAREFLDAHIGATADDPGYFQE